MKMSSVLKMLLLAALWGASFLFMRIAGSFGPVALVEVRVFSAAILLLIVSLWMREYLKVVKWKALL